jgi:membrane associated rhomboid family serine protease
MRPVRGRFGGGGFGLPSVQSMSAKLALGLVAGSVLALAVPGLRLVLQLVPAHVLRSFYVWQPLTYAFVEDDPLGIIFGGIMVWTIGGWLESVWGARRLLLVSLGGTALAGLLTVLVGLVVPLVAGIPYSGGWVMVSILWVANGLLIGRGQSNFWGLPVTGNMLAIIGAGFVVLRALQAGWVTQIPHLFGLVIAYFYAKGGSPRGLWLHFNHWRLQRQLRSRSRNLRVINSERPDDRFLN